MEESGSSRAVPQVQCTSSLPASTSLVVEPILAVPTSLRPLHFLCRLRCSWSATPEGIDAAAAGHAGYRSCLVPHTGHRAQNCSNHSAAGRVCQKSHDSQHRQDCNRPALSPARIATAASDPHAGEPFCTSGQCASEALQEAQPSTAGAELGARSACLAGTQSIWSCVATPSASRQC